MTRMAYDAIRGRVAGAGLLLCGLLVAVVLPGCQDNDAIAEMAAFDRALIPALMLTKNDDKSGRAVMAVNRLKFQWSTFKSRAGLSMADEGGDGAQIEEIIMEAYSLVNAGRTAEAHKRIEKVRGIIYSARKRAGMDYFPDRLTEFHEAMEPLVEAAARRDSARALSYLNEAKARWLAVEQAEIEREPFRMSKDQLKELESLIKAETEALGALEEALNMASGAADASAVAKRGSEVKKRFIAVYRQFGDFGAAGL